MHATWIKIRSMILALCLCTSYFLVSADSLQANFDEHTALYQRARNLFQAKQYLLSSIHFSHLSALEGPLHSQALFAYALSMVELGETSEALRSLSPLEKDPNPLTQSKAQLLRGFLLPDVPPSLPASSKLRLELWSSRFSSAEFNTKLDHTPLESQQRINLRDIHHDLSLIPQKSSLLAGSASFLLPGAGQAYVGNFQSAAIALILNSLFLATTLEFARKDLPTAAIASGTLLSVTYIGNILNAIDSAHRYNTNTRSAQEAQLRTTLFPEFTP